MSALVRKEIRLVLPAWIVAMTLAIVPVWVLWPGSHGYLLQSPSASVYAPFALGVLLLGLTPFGQELNCGTFSILLAQPVARRRLWLVKSIILATALSCTFLALLISLHVRVEYVIQTLKAGDWRALLNTPTVGGPIIISLTETQHAAFRDSLVIGGMGALAAFASGLWTNLLFRNTTAAFWLSLILPLGLGMLAHDLLGDTGLVVTLGVYSAAGFLWARKFFLRVQDTQWTGGVVSLASLFALKGAAPAGAIARRRKPLRALIRKEFQMHDVSLLIGGLLLMSHLVVIGVRRAGVDYFAAHHSAAMIWESWPLLWLAMPLLVGGAAVAEERKLGTLEGFLCLPTRRRREFAVKFLIALFLGVFLGGLMPLLVERLGISIGLPPALPAFSFEVNWSAVPLVGGLLLGSAGLVTVSFYASTLTRNLLHALGLAVGLCVFVSLVITLVAMTERVNFQVLPLWRGPLIGLIGWPVMAGTVLLLSYRNFKELNIGGRTVSRNSLALLSALAATAVLTTLLYHRVWELWMPDEPFQSNYARFLLHNSNGGLVGNSGAPKIEASAFRIAVLRDGRIWERRREAQFDETHDDETRYSQATGVPRKTGSWQSGFIGGHDWRDVAVSGEHGYAIQSDGSLWDISDVQPGTDADGPGPKRLGETSDWKNLASGSEHFLALKSDGTIWQWGGKWIGTGKSVSREKIAAPVPIGATADWIAVCDSWSASAALKSDGSIWRFGLVRSAHANGAWDTRVVEQPERWLNWTLPHGFPISLDLNPEGGSLVAVAGDGSLWVGGFAPNGLLDPQAATMAHKEMVRLGSDSEWAEAKWAGDGGLISVGRSGELAKWSRALNFIRGGQLLMRRRMMSRYFDWVATDNYEDSFLSLAADGSLCEWTNPHDQWLNSLNGPDPRRLLMPSRIKAKRIAEIQW